MPTPRLVTFTTDFGAQDTYVSQMKGAALALNPALVLVDLTHDVPPHDVATAAFLLETSFSVFPPGTIHVVVVDPGVGAGRRGIVVRTEQYYFIAPDNGVLTRVLDEAPAGAAYVLEAPHYRRDRGSPTFDGRDVFAPAAAWVSRGTELYHFGPPAGELARIELPRPAIERGRPFRVRVAWVDRFGNVTLDLPRRSLGPFLEADGGPKIRVDAPGGAVTDLLRTYADSGSAAPFLLFNSADYLELAVREGRAADKLGLARGDEVVILLE